MKHECGELEIADDETLLVLAQRGNPTAANMLFSRHGPILHRAALRYLRNREDAEDAVQDGLILAHRHLAQFEGRARFRTWLVSIISNTARTMVRGCRMSRTLSVEEGLQDPRQNPIKRLRHPGPEPDRVLAAQECRRILARTLRHLPADNRRALYLRYVKGLSVREAACSLGINEQTFKARLFRGRRRLATRLAAQNHGVYSCSFESCIEKKKTAPMAVPTTFRRQRACWHDNLKAAQEPKR
jgi:RNA polymerase sigma-70 factor, ECF subfamily